MMPLRAERFSVNFDCEEPEPFRPFSLQTVLRRGLEPTRRGWRRLRRPNHDKYNLFRGMQRTPTMPYRLASPGGLSVDASCCLQRLKSYGSWIGLPEGARHMCTRGCVGGTSLSTEKTWRTWRGLLSTLLSLETVQCLKRLCAC